MITTKTRVVCTRTLTHLHTQEGGRRHISQNIIGTQHWLRLGNYRSNTETPRTDYRLHRGPHPNKGTNASAHPTTEGVGMDKGQRGHGWPCHHRALRRQPIELGYLLDTSRGYRRDGRWKRQRYLVSSTSHWFYLTRFPKQDAH